MSAATSAASVSRTPSGSVRRHQSYVERDRFPTTPTRAGAAATTSTSPQRSLSQSQAPTHSRTSSGTQQLSNVARRDFEQTNIARPTSQRGDSREGNTLPTRADSTRQPSTRTAPHSRYNSQDLPPAVPVTTNGSTNEPIQHISTSTSGVRRRTTIDATTGAWELGKTIGAGSMGKVKLAKNKETGEQVRWLPIVTNLVRPLYSRTSAGCRQNNPLSIYRGTPDRPRSRASRPLQGGPYCEGGRDCNACRSSLHLRHARRGTNKLPLVHAVRVCQWWSDA